MKIAMTDRSFKEVECLAVVGEWFVHEAVSTVFTQYTISHGATGLLAPVGAFSTVENAIRCAEIVDAKTPKCGEARIMSLPKDVILQILGAAATQHQMEIIDNATKDLRIQ